MWRRIGQPTTRQWRQNTGCRARFGRCMPVPVSAWPPHHAALRAGSIARKGDQMRKLVMPRRPLLTVPFSV